MSNNTKTILMSGVGGQGTILAADILSRVAMVEGDDVKISEIHGMAQRGGAVTTVVRVGSRVASMVADKGSCDYLVSFEKIEALRNIEYLAEGGMLLVNDECIKSLPVATGAVPMPEGIDGSLSATGALLVPAEKLARQAGSVKAVNVVLLGALSAKMAYSEKAWLETIEQRVPAKFKDVNVEAFKLGRAYVRDNA